MSANEKEKEEVQEKRPHMFRRLWEWWKPVAMKIGDFNARVILTLFYCILMTPFAIILKLFTDPLRIKPKTEKRWLQRGPEKEGDPLERAAKQF